MKEIFSVVVCFIVWGILFLPFFKGTERFIRAIKLSFKPDIISLFLGGWRDEMKQEARLWIFICIGIASGVTVYRMLGGTPWFE